MSPATFDGINIIASSQKEQRYSEPEVPTNRIDARARELKSRSKDALALEIRAIAQVLLDEHGTGLEGVYREMFAVLSGRQPRPFQPQGERYQARTFYNFTPEQLENEKNRHLQRFLTHAQLTENMKLDLQEQAEAAARAEQTRTEQSTQKNERTLARKERQGYSSETKELVASLKDLMRLYKSKGLKPSRKSKDKATLGKGPKSAKKPSKPKAKPAKKAPARKKN